MPGKPSKVNAGTTDEPYQPEGASTRPAQAHIARVATLKDLRKATRHTQDDLAEAMGVGQGTISRIEKRDDMLVSTLQHYVESVGGTLQILVTFPDQPPLVVERLGKKNTLNSKEKPKGQVEANRQADP